MISQSSPYIYHTRIYYQDTDVAGVVYHMRYGDFAERARTEMLRDLGVSVADLESADGILMIVKKISLEFKYPARLDDLVEIRTYVSEFGRASVVFTQEFYCNDNRSDNCNDKLLVVAEVVMVGVKEKNGVFKPHPLPDRLKNLFTLPTLPPSPSPSNP